MLWCKVSDTVNKIEQKVYSLEDAKQIFKADQQKIHKLMNTKKILEVIQKDLKINKELDFFESLIYYEISKIQKVLLQMFNNQSLSLNQMLEESKHLNIEAQRHFNYLYHRIRNLWLNLLHKNEKLQNIICNTSIGFNMNVDNINTDKVLE